MNVLRLRVACTTLLYCVLFELLWNDLNIAICNVNAFVKNIRKELTLIVDVISEKCEWKNEKRAFR
jgi:hypothetical protein